MAGAPRTFTAVLTRPDGQSAALAAQLAAAGIDVLDFPLIDIAPLADDAPLAEAFARLDAYALVVFVSPNAVDHALARLGAIWPHPLPIGVVGPGSVAALARHGIAAPAHRVIAPSAPDDGGEPHYDSESLFAEIARAFDGEAKLAGKRVLIVRGDGGREWLVETARALGFDRITLTGAGDERIVRAFRTLADQADQPATAAPMPSRMTDTNDTKDVSSKPAAAPVAPPNQPFTPFETKERRGAASAALWFVVVVIAAAAGVGGYALNRKVDRLDQHATERQKALDAQTAELRTKTEQALASVRQADSQLSQLEGKLADAQTAQTALQQQYQDLSRNRDAWMIEEVGQMLSSASQQLLLTGNTQLALIALQNADARLASSQSAQAVVVRKAIAQDIERLKAAPSADLTGLAIKLDDAIAKVDTLPLAGEVLAPHAQAKPDAAASARQAAAAAGEPRWKAWWRGFSAGIGEQLKSLVEVRRIDHADAMLASPEQGYFVRENVKLRLLSARLSLLARDDGAMKSDLHAAQAAVARYFDGASKDTRVVQDLLKQVDAASLTVAVPNLNTSLNAVQQFKSRG
ncbi:fused uroporphyrinogen-III synthase HemD/membrane protein HemX [Burkholderia pseudomallei]|uniref:fused uroporphyrinogen-III synthase HemD/membrane protein HemX n=1 Tax=Burkholderia pseudomallei TaxID=28450 RepID=UPI00217EB9B2|nr:fused uroporphyrinogen-III synthase HemD/membrane protein HemX [Burkholderia pseudomallei]MCS6600624.1 fused uroporphyrinogen-III synthase HemD/membrane protein HemX [Burkholderia pseudomallei]